MIVPVSVIEVIERTESSVIHVLGDAGAVAALLAGVPYSWSALVTYLNARHAKRTGA